MSPRRHPRRPTTRWRGVLAVALVVAVAGCETPSVPGTGDASPAGSDVATPTPTVSSSADPAQEAVASAVAVLLASLRQAEDAFVELSRATDEDAATLATIAVAALAAEPDSVGVRPPAQPLPAPPLLPGPGQSREETIDHGDALTAATTAARDAGAVGSSLLDVLRDPIAGDLGAWQRDADGLLDLAVAVAAGARSIEEAEGTVSDLEGDALQALAWALIAARSRDPDTIRAAGERGAVHVSLMRGAVEALEPQA